MHYLKTIRTGVVAMGVLAASALSASAVTVTWNSTDFTGVQNVSSSNDFDIGYISFAGVVADSITSISGSGIYHNHGDTSDVFSMDVLLDGVWTNVWSDQPSDGLPYALSGISTPISFASGVVTGIRLSVSGAVSNAYHGMNGTSFELENVSPVPLPASLPLLLASLGVAGWTLRRKKA